MTQTAVYTEQQFIADLRDVFATHRDSVQQAHNVAALMRRAFESGWPENSEKFGDSNGTFEIYRDTEYGHPGKGLRRSRLPPGPAGAQAARSARSRRLLGRLRRQERWKHPDALRLPSRERRLGTADVPGGRGHGAGRRRTSTTSCPARSTAFRARRARTPSTAASRAWTWTRSSVTATTWRVDAAQIFSSATTPDAVMAASVAVGNRLITRHLISGRVAIDYPDVEVVDVGPAPAPHLPGDGDDAPVRGR